MDEHVSSATFRRTYASLKERTIVTANGRPIGVWVPVIVPEAWVPPDMTYHTEALADRRVVSVAGSKPLTQAERDAILRRVNKGG